MDLKIFLENFGVTSNVPDGINVLRNIILDLAVTGKLNSEADVAPAAKVEWTPEEHKLDKAKLWQLRNAAASPKVGWSRIPLARLGSWGSGGTPTASNRKYYENGSIPWAVIGDLNGKVLIKTESKITEDALDSSATKMIPIGAVLIAMYGASIGKTAITGIECCTNQAIAHCIPDQSLISTDYLFLVIRSLKEHLIAAGKGAAQPNISQSVLKHLLVDIPPLGEQFAITAAVNRLLKLCDELELQQARRNRLRDDARLSMIHSISAATGPNDLNTAWHRIHHNWTTFADTPESVGSLKSLVIDLSISGALDKHATFTRRALGSIVQLLNGDRSSNYPSKVYRVSKGIPFINAGHLVDGAIEFSNMDYVSVEKFESLRGGKIEAGDVLFCLRGSLGKCATVGSLDEGAIASSLVILRPSSEILPKYLLRYLESDLCKLEISNYDNGTAQPNLSAKSLRNFPVPVPDIETQQEIVGRIDGLMKMCDELASRLRNREAVAARLAEAGKLLAADLR